MSGIGRTRVTMLSHARVVMGLMARVLEKTKVRLLLAGGLIAALIVCMNLFLASSAIHPLLAQSWPTPPPKQALFPTLVPSSQVTPVAQSPRAGSVSTTLLPQIVLYPNLTFTSPVVLSSIEEDETQRVTLGMSRGTLPSTLQVLYEPLKISEVPPQEGARILRAFRFETFDHTGAAWAPELRRPFVLTIPYADLAPSGEARRLLVARLSEKTNEWLPLVTWLDRENGHLIARILEFGTFCVFAESVPVP